MQYLCVSCLAWSWLYLKSEILKPLNYKKVISIFSSIVIHICQQIFIYFISHLLKMFYKWYNFNILKANMESWTINLTITLLIYLTYPVFQVLICGLCLIIRFIIHPFLSGVIVYCRLSSKATNTDSALIFCTNNLFYCSAKRRTVRLKWFMSVPTPSVQSERWKHREKHTNTTHEHQQSEEQTHHAQRRTDEGQNTVFTVSSVSSDRRWRYTSKTKTVKQQPVELVLQRFIHD